jgi:MoaA/NifB/PqqE/SkfB family radical SAM enzyme
MSVKNKDNTFATLNIHGGESIFHPDILEILKYARNKKHKYQDWNLDISLITNAVIKLEQWKKIVNLVEKIFGREITNFDGLKIYSHENKFKGPF